MLPLKLSLPALKWLLVTSFVVAAQADLSMVFLVHRHGARSRLAPDGTELDEPRSVLTREGQRDMYALGQEVRTRYLQSPDCNTTCLTGNFSRYSHDEWHIQSTGTDWTLQAGQAFALGALPALSPNLPGNISLLLGASGGIQPVPIHSRKSENDWVLRAYADNKCDAIKAALDSFASSPEYAAKEAETKAMWDAINLSLGGTFALKDGFPVYDDHNTMRLYGANTDAGGPTTAMLDDAVFSQLKSVANWLEWNRYGSSKYMKSYCGGGLLADIMSRIEDFTTKTSVPDKGPQLVEYSGHYRSQLCLLSALDLTPKDPANDPNSWLQLIPTYGSVISVEVYQLEATQGFRVKFLLQDGPAAEFRTIVLPCSADGGDGSCLLSELQTATNASRYNDVKDWCSACGKPIMTECMASQASVFNSTLAQLSEEAGKSIGGGSGDKDGVPKWSLAVGTILGVLLGIGMGIAISLVLWKPFQSKRLNDEFNNHE